MPYSSPRSFPMVLIQKKDGFTRFCTNYMKLNDVSTKDLTPLPWMDGSLDARWFSTLDLLVEY